MKSKILALSKNEEFKNLLKQKKISNKAIDELKRMKWTGNIRELRNVIERLIILSEKNIDLVDVKKYVPGVI